MIKVVANLHFKIEKRDEFIAAFKALMPKVRQEDGCVEYDLYLDVADVLPNTPARGDVITVMETWASPEALQTHVAQPHFVAFIESTKDMMTGLTAQVMTKDESA